MKNVAIFGTLSAEWLNLVQLVCEELKLPIVHAENGRELELLDLQGPILYLLTDADVYLYAMISLSGEYVATISHKLESPYPRNDLNQNWKAVVVTGNNSLDREVVKALLQDFIADR